MNKNRAFLESSLSLAIAANIGAGIIANVTGNAVGTQIGDKPITRRSALTIFNNRLTANIVSTRNVGTVVGLLNDKEHLLAPVFDSAASLADVGTVIKPRESTPVNAVFVEANRAIATLQLKTEGTYEDQAANYHDVISSLLYGGASNSAAAAISDEIIQLGSRAVGSLTSLCHAHINPLIKECLDATRKRFQALYLDQSSAYDIKEQYLHPMLDNSVFVDHVESYAKPADASVSFVPLIGMNLLTAEVANALLYTGINSFDEEIKKIVDAEAGLIQITRDRIAGGVGKWFSIYNSVDRAQYTKELIVLFLMLRSMLLPDFQQRLTEANYSTNEIGSFKAAVMLMLGQAAGRLVEIAKAYEEEIKSGTIVLGYMSSTGRNLASVNGKAYQKLLNEVEEEEKGIDVAACIIAALFRRDSTIVTARDIYAKAEFLLKTYGEFRAEMEAATQARLATVAQTSVFQGIRSVVSSALSSFETANAYALTQVSSAEEYPNGESLGVLISKRMADVGNLLTNVRVSSPNDFESAIVKVVCAGLYPHVDAQHFFDIFDQVGKNMPEVEAREVAAVATIVYIEDWLMKQFIITENTVN